MGKKFLRSGDKLNQGMILFLGFIAGISMGKMRIKTAQISKLVTTSSALKKLISVQSKIEEKNGLQLFVKENLFRKVLKILALLNSQSKAKPCFYLNLLNVHLNCGHLTSLDAQFISI